MSLDCDDVVLLIIYGIAFVVLTIIVYRVRNKKE